MPAQDVVRLRRFYARHPFGPVRGDMQAFIGGLIARGSTLTFEKAMRLFVMGKTKEKPKEHPPITSEMLKGIADMVNGGQ